MQDQSGAVCYLQKQVYVQTTDMVESSVELGF